MFDLGMQELMIIFVITLIVFGPKRLPELGRTIGKGWSEIKKAMEGVKEQVDIEMKGLNEIKNPLALKNELYKTTELFKIDPEVIPSDNLINNNKPSNKSNQSDPNNKTDTK